MIRLTRRNRACAELSLGALRLFFVHEYLVLIRTPTAALARRGYYEPTAQEWWLTNRTIRHLLRVIGDAPITVVDDLEGYLTGMLVEAPPTDGAPVAGSPASIASAPHVVSVPATRTALPWPVPSGPGIGGGTLVPFPGGA